MANWCNNNVIFSGENVDKVEEMFDKLIEEQAVDGYGVRPDWEACEKYNALYLFNIEKHDAVSYRVETKWGPPLNTMLLIGRRFKVGFYMNWDEPGMGLYGRMVFDPSMPDVAMIGDASGTNFQYDEEKEMYIFEGEEYESEYEFMDDVVERTKLLPISKDQILQA